MLTISGRSNATIMNKKILNTNGKLLKLFRPPPTVVNEHPAGSNATSGPKIGQDLNNFDSYLADYLATWRVGTQEKLQ